MTEKPPADLATQISFARRIVDLAVGEASDADSPAPDVEIVICPPVGAAYRYE